MKLSEKGKEEINEIPDRDGWWHPSNGEAFCYLAEELMGKGFAIEFLGRVYSVVSDEYGN